MDDVDANLLGRSKLRSVRDLLGGVDESHSNRELNLVTYA
jgi:hypothetical protein